MSALPAGTRIRMKPTVWPERGGCEGVVVVAPNAYVTVVTPEVVEPAQPDPLKVWRWQLRITEGKP